MIWTDWNAEEGGRDGDLDQCQDWDCEDEDEDEKDGRVVEQRGGTGRNVVTNRMDIVHF